jgi:tetratricopeptide (TPR) repeat protein
MSARKWIPVVFLLLTASALASGEPDWYTRVKEHGLSSACEVDVGRHAKGMLPASLHVGECYYRLERYEEGAAVFAKLVRSPDRNYAAMALARLGEGYFHQGEPAKAKETFTRCLAEHPEAWLDGSVPDLCRAWLRKLAGKIPASPPAGA